MASEDVIELGSSDDEAEPAPKKKKPTPNAMVHIPTKLVGVTIKSAKTNPSPSLTGITVKHIKPNTMNQSKPNSGSLRIPVINNIVKDIKGIPVQNKISINPLNIAKNFSNKQVVLKKIPSNKRTRTALEIQGSKVLSTLPPGITIKPVESKNIRHQPILKARVSRMMLKSQTIVPKKAPKQVLTVEIDDEDIIESSTSSPQWYLRPEDQIHENKINKDNEVSNMEVDSQVPSMEEQNNKEPEIKHLVEITIEDSPIKPVYTKHQELGKEYTITIEDSPVKPIVKNTKEVESDNENNDVSEDVVPQSRKKLIYQKTSKVNEKEQIEIEIDMKVTDSNIEIENKTKPESPKEIANEINLNSPKNQKDIIKVDPLDEDILKDNAKGVEFHPVYQKFIDTCFRLENSNDMEKIVEKKIKAYYKQCHKEYVESEEFIDMVSSKIISMETSPEKMYLYIKDIVDELNLQRKMIKSVNVIKENVDKASDDNQYEETQYDSKKRRQIRKLEKTIKKLHRAIQKLEEQEVDFDDDEDSVYLLTERYKERMVRVHLKFCQLTNTKMPSEPRIHIEGRPGRPSGPAKKLEKWINRKVPIRTPLPFPDFHDVLRCVRDANEEDKLGWNEMEVMEEARDLFTRCGRKLQRRRQENEWRIAASRISANPDPAENNADLRLKLDENKTLAAKKETELLNKYVDRQNQLKLEAEEIGDKEADESPVESEEDEVVEDSNSMENKQKRKQRLKRLLNEKNKKDENKENCVVTVPQDHNKSEAKERESEQNQLDKESDGHIEEKSNDSELAILTLPDEIESKDKEIESPNEEQNVYENYDSDINMVESDVDELHLLQKLHSENEANSSSLDSDSDTPIAISDTLESDSEIENGVMPCDVISIEDSSYSEGESVVEEIFKETNSNFINKQNLEERVNENIEIEYSSAGIEASNTESSPVPVPENITEEVEENILLATSDEEESNKAINLVSENTCINLRDDNISISEMTIDEVSVEEDSAYNYNNTNQESNNGLNLVEECIDGGENNCTLDVMKGCSDKRENSVGIEKNSLRDTPQESRIEDDATKTTAATKDIVDASTSHVNSVESAELQTSNENRGEDSREKMGNINNIESISIKQDMITELFDSSIQKHIDIHKKDISGVISATESS